VGRAAGGRHFDSRREFRADFLRFGCGELWETRTGRGEETANLSRRTGWLELRPSSVWPARPTTALAKFRGQRQKMEEMVRVWSSFRRKEMAMIEGIRSLTPAQQPGQGGNSNTWRWGAARTGVDGFRGGFGCRSGRAVYGQPGRSFREKFAGGPSAKTGGRGQSGNAA